MIDKNIFNLIENYYEKNDNNDLELLKLLSRINNYYDFHNDINYYSSHKSIRKINFSMFNLCNNRIMVLLFIYNIYTDVYKEYRLKYMNYLIYIFIEYEFNDNSEKQTKQVYTYKFCCFSITDLYKFERSSFYKLKEIYGNEINLYNINFNVYFSDL